MSNEEIISIVQPMLESFLVENKAHFLVSIKIKPTNNIKIYLDGDSGIGIDELVQYNRALYKAMEEAAIFPEGDFSLEVSSAGLDEPLKTHRQYVKNIGRLVEVVLTDGQSVAGKLLSAAADTIVLEEIKGKGKKAETLQHTLPYDTIKTTKVQIIF